VAEQNAYAWAGVDIEGANQTKRRIGDLVKGTFGPEVLTDIGGFGGLFAAPWREYDDPVLVASTDGVGTKLKIAFITGVHDTVGADLVSHCANDILVQGARPMFFLDYLAMGKHEGDVAEAVIAGVANGCKTCGCALLGGEMAEMPGFYAPGEYDLAGTIVGMVDRDNIITGERVRPGHVLIGIASDGLHTNGYSLARKLLFQTAGYTVESHIDDIGATVGSALLAPHRPYVKPVIDLLKSVDVAGMAHITGGGLIDNIPRSLPDDVAVRVHRDSWPIPPLFQLLQRIGEIPEIEMFQDFNMGIGYVILVREEDADTAVRSLTEAGEDVHVLGEAVSRAQDPQVRIGD
jgi:phosphoribosylformylglycinamidine cyclo-ligase